MARKKIDWKVGAIFGVPIEEGLYCLGQILTHEKQCMDSILCAFTNVKSQAKYDQSSAIQVSDLISIQLVTRDSIDEGIWPILGACEPLKIGQLFPIESFRAAEYVGAKIRGSGIMQNLVSAYNGNSNWDQYFDPLHFNKLLLPGVQRPVNAIFKGSKG